MALIAVIRVHKELVTTTAAVTSTMQNVEYVKYNTTTDQNPPEADHCCGRGKGKQKKGLPS
jgi:hypothetical protein